MTEKEYAMSFGEWCNATQGTHLKLTPYGDIDFRDGGKHDATAQYMELWKQERQEYVLREKNQRIMTALQALRVRDIEVRLCNYQNGHIKARSAHGIIYSYYATTGTIAGYKDTSVAGLDEFIRLCEEE